MNLNENLINLPKRTKKKICSNISINQADSYLTELKLLCEPLEVKQQNNSVNGLIFEVGSSNYYCHSCEISFQNVSDMRKHWWKKSHLIKKGWITPDYLKTQEVDDSEDEDENNNELNQFNYNDFEEEIEVDNDNEEDELDDINQSIESTVDNSIDKTPNLPTNFVSFYEFITMETLYFKNVNNDIVGIKRCLLFQKNKRPQTHEELLDNVKYLSQVKKTAVFLYSGGCFSGAIFEGDKAILHKTIKRYTVRKKQGGSQITHDYAGKSAGGFLRRVNTEKLFDDVFNLIHKDWASHVKESQLIIVWSARCQRYIFGSQQLINNTTRQKLAFDVTKDPRVRCGWGRVSRVNSSTLLQSYRELATIEVFDEDSISYFQTVKTCSDEKCLIEANKKKESPRSDESNQSVKTSKKQKKKNKKKQTENEEVSEEEDWRSVRRRSSCMSESAVVDCLLPSEKNEIEINEDDVDDAKDDNKKEEDVIRDRLLTMVIDDNGESLRPYLMDLKESRSEQQLSYLVSIPLKSRNQSLLHLAVRNGRMSVIQHLLEFGCDPVHRSVDNETPFALGLRLGQKEACDIMTDYMFNNPQQYDYFAAKFPGGKDPLKELEKREQSKLKKKQKRKEKNQRMKEQNKQRKDEIAVNSVKENFLALDNDAKKAHIRNVKLVSRNDYLLCFQCAQDISHIVPFSYCDFSFCSMNCLRVHRFSSSA